jgi:hypothetical protein
MNNKYKEWNNTLNENFKLNVNNLNKIWEIQIKLSPKNHLNNSNNKLK